MPVLNPTTVEALPNGQYGYSAARIEDLGASEYTLVTVVADVSGSVTPYAREMEKTLGAIVRSCRVSPRADNLLIRLVTFNSAVLEPHGFRLLSECKPDDYDGSIRPHGSTALFDASANAVGATTNYAKKLADAGFAVNGILFVMTDGMDNASRGSAQDLQHALRQATSSETLESLVSVLIGLNVQDNAVSAYLKHFQTEGGFTSYIEIGRADVSALARLADFVSRSISNQSQSLGSGGPSRPLTF